MKTPSILHPKKIFEASLMLILTLSFYILLFFNPFIVDYSFLQVSYIPHVLITGSVAAILLFDIFVFRRKCHLNLIDLALAGFVLSVVLSRLSSVGQEPVFNDATANTLVAFCFYVATRYASMQANKIRFFHLLLPALLVEIILVLMKVERVATGSLSYMSLTGTLANSGICAAFIVIFSPFLLQLVKTKRTLKYMFIIFLCAVLIILNARASFLGFLPVLWYYTLPEFNIVYKKVVSNKVILAMIACLMVVIIVWLYQYRRDSADGRLFIWKLTFSHIFDHPLTGIGYGEFPESYKNWQRDYFAGGNYAEREAILADLPSNPFNFLLQVWAEQGLLGIASLSFLLYVVAKCQKRVAVLNPPIKIGILGGFIVSLFSYPYSSMPVLIGTFIMLALIDANTIEFTACAKWRRVVELLLILPLSYCSISYYVKRYKIRDFRQTRALGLDNLEAYRSLSPYLTTNSGFLYMYAQKLYQAQAYQQSTIVLKSALKQGNQIEAELLLGKTYEVSKLHSLAEKQYLHAINILPYRLTARYFIFQYYIGQRDTLKAIAVGQYILQAPVKSNSLSGMQIKYDVELQLRRLRKIN